MNRKTLIIVSGIIIALIVGLSAYFYFSKEQSFSPAGPGFPEGSGLIPSFGVGQNGNNLSTGEAFVPGSNASLPVLYQLHKLPVADVGTIETGKNSDKVFFARYIERGLGHIFETKLSTYEETRIVNETRSRITEAHWGNNGKSVAIRFVDENNTIKTRVLNIGAPSLSFAKSTSTESIADNFLKTEEVLLPDNIPFMAVAEDGTDKLFYLENASGFTSSYKNTGVTKIFSSAFTEWLPQFPNQKLVTLTTRPSAKVPGHLFFLNPSTKSVTKVLGDINGLTTLTSPDGKYVLFSETKDGVPELSVYSTSKETISPLFVQTLPEKCVWGRKKTISVFCAVPQPLMSADYPDQWYQGLISFSDELWEINATALSATKVMSPKTFGVNSLDMTNLALSSGDEYLVFMDKVSGTPWVYQVTEQTPLTAAADMQKVN